MVRCGQYGHLTRVPGNGFLFGYKYFKNKSVDKQIAGKHVDGEARNDVKLDVDTKKLRKVMEKYLALNVVRLFDGLS